MRSDSRDKSLNAMRQLIDDVDAGRFPGLVLVVTGTPAFFDGPHCVPRLPPLAQRLHVDFLPDPAYDNPRAVQIRLPGFSSESLLELGGKVRALHAADCSDPDRVRAAADDAYLRVMVSDLEGQFGGRIGVAPRVFVKKLVDVLDRIDQYSDFDPRTQYALRLGASELTPAERAAMASPPPLPPAGSVDDIDLPT